MFEDKETFKTAFVNKLQATYGTTLDDTSALERYQVLSGMVREYIGASWAATNAACKKADAKQVYYFSLEFLSGRLLGCNLINLGLYDMCAQGLAELGIDIRELERQEHDAGLGNGGLGRLAACFLDSLASCGLLGHGCGIRYRYGLFTQKIVDAYQVELPDDWLQDGYAWEVRKPHKAVEVRFGGTVRVDHVAGRLVFTHENYQSVLAVPYDVPITGYGSGMVNTLRLWSAESAQPDFDFATFSRGDYRRALVYRNELEEISHILYPDDSHDEGRRLRLKQEYFLAAAGVKSILRHYLKNHTSLADLPRHVAIHINDTHPALVIPELMRLLMDEQGLGWDEAWRITTATVSYTNHTVMPEALEKWSVDMFRTLLPRIYMIVEEIDRRFGQELWRRYPGDIARVKAMAVINDGFINMAHLAVIGSHSVNGVSQLHSRILREQVLGDFYQLYPGKFCSVTNGVTHRRWLQHANPALARLITDTIGDGWLREPEALRDLAAYADDAAFQAKVAAVKWENKVRLARLIKERTGLTVDPASVFDAQIKRFHSYKRQILNVLHIIDLYNRLRRQPELDVVPRTFIFAGKAAPSYLQAKQTIKIINTLAGVINACPYIKDKIKVVFLEDYGVSLAEAIVPAVDVSEQISAAGTEASGTGNMKMMLNGAVTLGTRDGANIEIAEAVGEENIILFGLTAEEISAYHQHGGYSARQVYNSNPRVREVLQQLADNGFLPTARQECRQLSEELLAWNDEYFVLADFESYVAAQSRVDALYRQSGVWRRMCIHNIAQAGRFSSDRAVREYARNIWRLVQGLPAESKEDGGDG